jgi:AraC-like DNA-binding protein
MIDPLAQIVSLLEPRSPHSKISTGAGRWIVRRAEAARPFYCAVLEGGCRVTPAGGDTIQLDSGDFILIPSAEDFEMSSLAEAGPADIVTVPTLLPNGEYRVGATSGPHEVRMLIGYCEFGSSDAKLLVSLLPRCIHIRGRTRFMTLLQLLFEEVSIRQPAHEIVTMRLLDVLFIEALRAQVETEDASGLLQGLADERISIALRRIHGDLAESWTVPRLASEAGVSRSAFFERFKRVLGMSPMEYVLAWRMAVAKDLLQREKRTIAEVALHIGYSSANTFSIAFTRHVGIPPSMYAQQ